MRFDDCKVRTEKKDYAGGAGTLRIMHRKLSVFNGTTGYYLFRRNRHGLQKCVSWFAGMACVRVPVCDGPPDRNGAGGYMIHAVRKLLLDT